MVGAALDLKRPSRRKLLADPTIIGLLFLVLATAVYVLSNGHRWNILMSGPAVGYGAGSGASVGDFGGTGTATKIVSGSHYPRQAASVEAWANWYDTQGPHQALVNVDGTCTSMMLTRGAVTNGAYKATLANVA